MCGSLLNNRTVLQLKVDAPPSSTRESSKRESPRHDEIEIYLLERRPGHNALHPGRLGTLSEHDTTGAHERIKERT